MLDALGVVCFDCLISGCFRVGLCAVFCSCYLLFIRLFTYVVITLIDYWVWELGACCGGLYGGWLCWLLDSECLGFAIE